jgi:hypothetical protein
MQITKLVSGGESGADIGGLRAARDLGVLTGGTAPKGWRICLPDGSEGSNPDLGTVYGLVEHKSRAFPPSTKQNVVDSDGTVWFGYEDGSGLALNRQLCSVYSKPLLVNPSAERLASWVVEQNISVLNVAGSRASSYNPLIESTVYELVKQSLLILRRDYDISA